MDMNSHHGTHLRKADQTVSKMLSPETATLLCDGDIITFGKSVGKNESVVRPVVARVELLYGSQPDAPVPSMQIKSLVLPDSPSSSVSPKTPKSVASGRYGIYIPSSPSEDGSSIYEPMDYSDVEEIASPAPLAAKTASIPTSKIARALDAVKKMIPPAHSSASSLAPYSSPKPSNHPVPSFELSPGGFSDAVIGFDAGSNDVFESYNKSPSVASSMDLSSPSPPTSPMLTPPGLVSAHPEALVYDPLADPIIVGAWPTSRFSSPEFTKVVSSRARSRSPATHSNSPPLGLNSRRSSSPFVPPYCDFGRSSKSPKAFDNFFLPNPYPNLVSADSPSSSNGRSPSFSLPDLPSPFTLHPAAPFPSSFHSRPINAAPEVPVAGASNSDEKYNNKVVSEAVVPQSPTKSEEDIKELRTAVDEIKVNPSLYNPTVIRTHSHIIG